jgi:hypothetical protein
MSLQTTLGKYMKTNASVTQKRMTLVGARNKSLRVVNGTDAAPLQLSIWPLTLTWKLRGGGTYDGDRLEDRFGWAISDITYDIQPGDVLVGYPRSDSMLECRSVNLYNDGNQPIPHLSGILTKYSHQG